MEQNGEKQKSLIDRIAERWQKSLEEIKEYEIIEQENEAFDDSRSELSTSVSTEDRDFREEGLAFSRRSSQSFFSGIMFDREFQEAQKLKRRLLRKYEDRILEEVIAGEELVTEKGVCYSIKSQDKVDLRIINPIRARNKILSDLKLVYGIGQVTERNLKSEGYKTIEDLINHPRFGFAASNFLKGFEEGDRCTIIEQITQRYWVPKSHPLVFYSSSFFNKESFVILDIETLGLFTRPIILFGVARISGRQIQLNQYLLRDIHEEPAGLAGLLSLLKKNSVFVTYNGQAFDIPYINQRLAFYQLHPALENMHFDLLHFARRAWKSIVPDCRLTTLERHLLDIERKDDVPSQLVPDFYDTYLRTKNVGPLIPIIEHNKQDLISLAYIFSKLHEEWGE